MKIRSLGYQIRQGVKNIIRNKMFSLASVATMSACIFVLGAFLAIIMNVNSIRQEMERQVGITVFFDEGSSEESIMAIGEEIQERVPYISEMKYISAEDAWEQYKEEYFKDDPSLADGFKDDNPLAHSASYVIYVDEIEHQEEVKNVLGTIQGIRKINDAADAVKTLKSFNRLFTYICVAIVVVLFLVSVLLISNTINVGISVRKEEIGIMKLIGSTDRFVRAPFIVEGIILGFVGAVIPLGILYIAYSWLIRRLLTHFSILSSIDGVLLNVKEVFRYFLPLGLAFGIGIGLAGAIITIRKHLDV